MDPADMDHKTEKTTGASRLGAFETDARVIRDRDFLRQALADTDTERAKIREAKDALREGEAALAQAIARENDAFADLVACIAIVREGKP